MAAERSFVAIKPDGVQRGLVGEIIGRFERKGFKLVGLKQITPSRELAEQHYGVQRSVRFAALWNSLHPAPWWPWSGKAMAHRRRAQVYRCHQAAGGGPARFVETWR